MAETREPVKRKASNSSNTVPITDIIFMTLRHWPWILLSVAICVGAAYVYLLRTPNVYTRAAEIMIKDDTKGKSLGGEEFANLGLIQASNNIQNEITNLTSKDIMEEVVRRLGLDYNYYIDGRFHNVVAYGFGLPVKVNVVGLPEEQWLSLEAEVDSKGEVTISKLVCADGDFSSDKYTGTLSDSIATPVGKIVVSPTSSYQEGKDVSLIVSKIPLAAARDSYKGRLGVSKTSENGTVIRLTMADQSIQRADDVLNTLINVYNENWIRDRNQIAVSTSNFINDRLGVIESELGNVDSDISSYKSANLVPNVEAAASMYMNQSQAAQARLIELNNQLQMTRYIRSYLASDANNNQLLPANTGGTSGNIQNLISQYNEKLLQRNSLVDKSSESNPLVQQLDEQLRQQRQAIVSTVDNEIIQLNALIKSAQQSEAQTVSKLASNPNQAKNLLSVERQQKVKESLYLFLLQKREENELSQAFSAYNTRVINKPGASGIPSTPNRRNILGMAFLIGLAIPFGFTYVKETTNTRVRGRKDVQHLAVPFLGEIPQYVSSKVDTSQRDTLVVQSGKRNIINESFRVLRTNVEFMSHATEGHTSIAITSFNPGSGKSFITVNLAASLALKGRKVLVIDGDMRHGSASAYIGSPDEGLSNFLSNSNDDVMKYIVGGTLCENLDFLPVGAIPPNPTELLESPRYAEMMKTLRPVYDYIITDCPPIEVVADAQIIDRQADRTFFIIRAGLLERAMLPELDRLYDEKKYVNMAFILNGTRNEQGRYGYAHSYRYGYGYGYGYGYNYGEGDGKRSKKKRKTRL